jgi:rRNA maturation endonuclease Nob1
MKEVLAQEKFQEMLQGIFQRGEISREFMEKNEEAWNKLPEELRIELQLSSRLVEAIKVNNLEELERIRSSYITYEVAHGMEEALAQEKYQEMHQRIFQCEETYREFMKKNKETEEKQVYDKDKNVDGIIKLISFLLSILLALGCFFLILKLSASWVASFVVALSVLYLLFIVIRWGIHSLYNFIQMQKADEELRKKIKENKRWVWLCQRCEACYEYNGEDQVFCDRCGNLLIKVMGMRRPEFNLSDFENK